MNKKTFIVGALLLGAAATAWWAKNQIKLLNDVSYDIKNYTVLSVNKQRIILKLNYEVKNKGAFDITIRGYNFDIYGDGQYLAQAYSNEQVRIAPFSTVQLPIEIAINFRTVAKSLGDIISVAQNWKNIFVELKGRIRVQKGAIPFPIPYRDGYTLKEISEWYK